MVVDDLMVALDYFLLEARRSSKRRALKPVERKLERALRKAFRAQGKAFREEFKALKPLWPSQQAQEGRAKSNHRLRAENARTRINTDVFSEAIDPEVIGPMFDKAAIRTLEAFSIPIQVAARAALQAGGKKMIAGLGLEGSFSLANPRAAAYLAAHGAELVRLIDETTRGDLQYMVGYAAENGWSYSKTALAIQKRFQGYYDPGSWWNFDAPRPQGHIDSRAHLIAVTESGNAYEAGNFMVVQDLSAAGIETEKSWSTMKDNRVSQGCQDNEAEGWIPAEQAHLSGHMHPLRFPGCRCDELYRVKK